MKTANELQEILALRSDIDVPIFLEGHKYRLVIGRQEIIISEPLGVIERTYFKAEYFSATKTVSFAIHTRDSNNLPVPGLYARELFLLAISYFESHFPVQEIYSTWIEGSSDNYTQYQQGINAKMSFEEAARNTWTGKIAVKLGFTKPVFISEVKHPNTSDIGTQTYKVLSLIFVKDE